MRSTPILTVNTGQTTPTSDPDETPGHPISVVRIPWEVHSQLILCAHPSTVHKNTRLWINAGQMLGQRRRHLTSVVSVPRVLLAEGHYPKLYHYHSPEKQFTPLENSPHCWKVKQNDDKGSLVPKTDSAQIRIVRRKVKKRKLFISTILLVKNIIQSNIQSWKIYDSSITLSQLIFVMNEQWKTFYNITTM